VISLSDSSLTSLNRLIKEAALAAVAAANPAGIFYGEVISVAPLKIEVEQKLTLDEKFLELSSLVRNIDIDTAVSWETGNASAGDAHTHTVAGFKTITLNLGLAVGDKVVMLRVQGGQKYLVLDRVV
jgi:hypothetical protein